MEAYDDEPRTALVDRVYGEVKALIVDLDVEAGERLGIEALARRLDVSPTPVREALARLEAEGLVVKRSQAGYRASEALSPDEVSDLFEMRLLLEPYAAGLAAGHATDAQLDELEDLVERMRAAPEHETGPALDRTLARLDQRFHDRLVTAAGRPLLLEAVRRLHAHVHMFRVTSASGARELTLAEHERILRSILRRGPERAEAAMVAHLERSRARHALERRR